MVPWVTTHTGVVML